MSYPLARDDTDRSTGFYDANGIVIAAESPDTEWAKAFVSHILSYDLQSTMGQVISGTPVRNDIPTDVLEVSYDPAVAQIYNRVVSEGTHRIFNTIMPGEYRPAATQLIQGLIGGQLTPEEFAEEFTAMVQSVH